MHLGDNNFSQFRQRDLELSRAFFLAQDVYHLIDQALHTPSGDDGLLPVRVGRIGVRRSEAGHEILQARQRVFQTVNQMRRNGADRGGLGRERQCLIRLHQAACALGEQEVRPAQPAERPDHREAQDSAADQKGHQRLPRQMPVQLRKFRGDAVTFDDKLGDA